jgi:hypothetical protein
LVVLVLRVDVAITVVAGAADTDTFEAIVTTEVLATTEGLGGTEVLTTFDTPPPPAAPLVIAPEPTKVVKSEADERSTGILLKRTETNHPRY